MALGCKGSSSTWVYYTDHSHILFACSGSRSKYLVLLVPELNRYIRWGTGLVAVARFLLQYSGRRAIHQVHTLCHHCQFLFDRKAR